jgi:outer membrane receptor protein involved in Fe transport
VFKTNHEFHTLRSTLLLGVASAAAAGMPAMAQDNGGGNVETVVVTGSRIPQTGVYSASPVTAVGQQEMKFEGTTDINTLINNLPEAFADQNSTVTNGGTGTANLDLRGLGANRTLVLVNGTRLMPGDPSVPVADVNDIPVALVDHVEVLTGGASAVYGSDALAGVVNFIMRKDFEGIELDGQYSIDNAPNDNTAMRGLVSSAGFKEAPENVWDGSTTQGTLIMGTNTANDKGNVTAYLGYQNTQQVLSGARDFSSCGLISLSVTALGYPPNGGFACVGSSNYNRWEDIQTGGDYFETGTGKPGTGKFVPFVGGVAQSFNFGPLQYLQRPDTRYQGGFFGHYQENKQLDIYTSFMFTDDRTVEQLAPSGLFLGSGVISGSLDEVNCSNPLMTLQEKSLVCPAGATQAKFQIGRRDIEGGDRVTTLDHESYRMNIGARGDLGNGWSYDIYGQYGQTEVSQSFSGNFSKSRVQNALEVDPATGKCYAAEPNAQGIVIDANCVPLDIFNGIGSISPAALKYVADTGFQEGYTTEQIVSGSLTGDLGAWGIESPWAKNPVAISIGSEWRSEELERNVSRDFYSDDIDGSGGATLPVPQSGFRVAEGFTEIKVPLAQGLPWLEDLSATGGYRYSSYSIAGGVSAYKDGIEWQPIDDVRFRASFERAVRAPNVLELFAPLNVVLFSGQDPCATITTGQCASVKNAGNNTLLSCPAAQCNNQLGGSTALKPETSGTRTVGFVFTPTFLDGFTATVDYWDIKVSKFITAIGSPIILAECYGPAATPTTEAAFCPLIQRNSLGQIYGSGFVVNTTKNTGYLHTDGVDIELNYAADMADWGAGQLGSLDFNLVGTWLDSSTTEPVAPPNSVGTFDCAGLFGTTCPPSPKWRHKFRVTWTSPWNVDVSVDWRHTSGLNFDANASNPLLDGDCGVPCGDVSDNHISSFDWFDIATDWQVRQGVDLRAGVTNLFAKDPPYLDTNFVGASSLAFFGNGNTYPGVYDSLGRTIFIGATIKY